MQNINFVIVLTYCTINIINGGVSRSRTIAAAGRPGEGEPLAGNPEGNT